MIGYYLFGEYNAEFSNIDYHIFQVLENTFRGTIDNTENEINLSQINDMTKNK